MTPQPKRNVLLLGATGFIGEAILHALLEAGNHRVMALQHNRHLPVIHEDLYPVPGSIGTLDPRRLPFPPEIVIHAARNRTGRFGSPGRSFMALKGYLGNRRLLGRLKTLKDKPVIIYCSGSLMYGNSEGLIDESHPLNPVSFARQYIRAEIPFLQALKKKDLPVMMLRLPWVIGNGSWFRWNYMQLMQDNRFIPVYGGGENKMSFVDADMIGKAIIELIVLRFSGVLNLYHPLHLTQREWAGLLADVSGLPVKNMKDQEMNALSAATLEAFTTNIRLGSMHKDIQAALLRLHAPLPDIVHKHLSAFQHK